MPEQKPAERSSSSFGIAATLLLLCLLLALYVLSLGPAIWLVRRHSEYGDWFMVIYMPLEWLYEAWEPVRPVFDWYIGLWD